MLKDERPLIFAGLLLILLASQATSMIIPGDGDTGDQQNDDFSDIQVRMNSTFTSSPSNLTQLGKELRLRIKELRNKHVEALGGIKLRRRLFNEEMKEKGEELLSEFNKFRSEYVDKVKASIDKFKVLREGLKNGTITKEEYSAEVEGIRLELKSLLNLMLKLGKEIRDFGKAIATRNREFARELLDENKEFKEELEELLEEAREAMKDKGPP